MADKLSYLYYPGCSLESLAKEYDQSVRACAELVDVSLTELEDWNCCGASSGHCTNRELAAALPARNLAMAEKAGQDVAVACAACFLRFRQTTHDLRKDDALLAETVKAIGMPFEAKVETRHFVDIFAREVGLEEITKRVKKPLTGLKVVCYYGCYLVRPPEVTQFDDPENPTIMDELMTALGAETLKWTHKVECCGGNLMLSRSDIVTKLVDDITNAAREAGAEAIVTACPLCEANLDTRQTAADGAMPAFYFSELMALALGADSARVKSWMKRHVWSPSGVLQGHNLI
jgi:heterodisulfide reductase subunit B